MEPLLFLAHRVPVPPTKGDKIRSYHMLRALAERHRVYFGAFMDDPRDRAHLPKLAELCAESKVVELRPRLARLRSLQGLLQRVPLTVPYYRSAVLADWIRSTVARHGIRKALVFSSGMAQYQDLVPEVQFIIDFVDVDSAKWTEYGSRRRGLMAAVYRREGELLLQFERRAASRAMVALFATSAEAALFQQLAPECAAKTIAVLNGVDSEYFASAHEFPSPYPQGERAIVFTGVMDYWPNVDAVCWFAREVFPLIRAQEPAARFYIVGMNPSPVVRGLACDTVVVTGRVEDVRPYLRHAAVAVAPLRLARGVQNKVLEAMAMSRPVVASEAAAMGLAVRPGEDLVVADSAPDFAGSVLGFLKDPPSGDAMGLRARLRVLETYCWESNLESLERLLSGQPAGARAELAERLRSESQAA
jgi:sugar transferase (PEP-CTERM/EpsH1 system associated)